jgi:Macrocin-O-methyltransferase (TylF)
MTIDSSAEHPRLAQARASLEAARLPHARGPEPGIAELRAAYLDLLKLSLCDLAGSGTTSVGRTPDGQVMARELEGDQLKLRSAGMDWPLHGLTMVGLARLDDLQACVESVVENGVEGDLIEAGAWRGGASILMRATLDSLGEERAVWVADSFQGFPAVEPEHRRDDELDVFDFLAVAEEEVRGHFARFGTERGVRFVPGFFEDTMRDLARERWSVVRLDGDSYDATWLTLQSLYPGLSVGGHLIVDDYGALDECRQAVEEFREGNGIDEPLEQIDWTCVRWRKEADRPLRTELPAPRGGQANGSAPSRPVARPEGSRVPTIDELELRRQISELEQRIAGLEDELEWLRGSPFRAPNAWLRQRLRRGG